MSARQPVQVIEIDVDACALTYGVGLCPAALGLSGNRKCFNTFATCQAPSAFAKAPLTLRFATPTTRLPRGQTVFPALVGVSGRPASVTLAGVDPSRGPLGRRATVTVRLVDFPYHDRLTDKYAAERVSGAAQLDEPGYDPAKRSTFFAKLRARWPYYAGRPLRVRDGYIRDGAIVDERVQHFVITGFDGPDDNGDVTLEAKDVLALADDERALAPRASNGRLAAAITVDATTLTLTPTGVGAEYPESGRAVVGSEIVAYTRAGDVITMTARGVAGTQAATHSAGDTFQIVLRFDGARLDTVIRTLLVDYAGVDPSWIDDWEPEVTRWLAGLQLSAHITAPTGVASLIGELAVLGVSIWWNSEAQKIKLRANRPPDGETVHGLTDRANIVAVRTEDRPDERLTQVLFYHDIIDPTKSATEPSNFNRLTATADLGAEAELAYGDTRVRRIFSRWLGPTQDNEVAGISARLLSRFRTTPRLLHITVDAKDRGIGLAAVAQVETRINVDETGAVQPGLFQVTAVEETSPGHQIELTVQTYEFAGRYGFITRDDRPRYSLSSPAQRDFGAYIAADAPPPFPDGSAAYRII